MHPSYIVLAAFSLWTLLWLLPLVVLRITKMRKGESIAEFSPHHDSSPSFYQRVMRIHSNCLETLPIYASLVLVAGSTGFIHILSGAAVSVFFGARIIQSLIHAYSSKGIFPYLRGSFFGVQVALMIYWAIMLLTNYQGLVMPAMPGFPMR